MKWSPKKWLFSLNLGLIGLREVSLDSQTTISVIGLGYVGLPVAVEMSKKFKVVGFDISEPRIDELKNGFDRTEEYTKAELSKVEILYTFEVSDLKKANFHIVAVPTPIDDANHPDLSILKSACAIVAKALSPGDIVVFESTVYPGATEEDCIPILEELSQLRAGTDFKVGYSPERINPGDKEHSFTQIVKVVSGQDQESLDKIAHVYGSVVTAGIFKANSIKVAEAAKVIENTQRDLNIALMNELALIFEKLDLDTLSVIEAASTKWNFLPFKPGLVGGHCIGVDPYYLTYRAEKAGYHPQVILAGRRINDNFGKFIAQKTIKTMIKNGLNIIGQVVTIMGLTFKEDCPDLRNTRVIDIIRELEDYGLKIQVCDPRCDSTQAFNDYGIELVPLENLQPSAVAILAVAHKEFTSLTGKFYSDKQVGTSVIVDVKGAISVDDNMPDGVVVARI